MLSVKLCDVTCVSFTCLLGSILGGTGLILTSTAGSLETLYATHSFLFGLGTSLMYTPSLVIVARWFDQWRSIATGLVVASGSLGQVVLSPLLHFLMESYGVLDTFRWWGVIFMVTTVLSSTSFYLLDRRDSKESKQSGISKYSIKWTLLRDKAYVTWLIIMMICNFTYYIPLIHLVSSNSCASLLNMSKLNRNSNSLWRRNLLTPCEGEIFYHPVEERSSITLTVNDEHLLMTSHYDLCCKQ